MKKLRPAFADANPIWKVALFSAAALLLVALAVLVAMQQPYTSSNLITPLPKGITVSFAADQGILLSVMTGASMRLIPGDVLVMIPNGVVPDGGTLVAEQYQPDILGEAGESGWSRPQIVNLDLQDNRGSSLSGTILAQPLEICFVLAGAHWEFFLASPSSFDVQYYDVDHDPPKWQSLPTITYADQQRFCGQITHLTLIALAIRIEPPPSTDRELYEP